MQTLQFKILMDVNGNKRLHVRAADGGASTSVQTNGNLPRTHCMPLVNWGKPWSQADMLTMWKELKAYAEQCGSPLLTALVLDRFTN